VAPFFAKFIMKRLENRIFICFVIVVIAIFFTGCSTTKWEWIPKEQPKLKTNHEKETGVIKVNVLKVSF
jgi:hypothetical protein